MQIREVITEFHFDCQVRKLSPKTIALYDRQLEYLVAFMEESTGITIIEEVRSIHIKKFLVGKADLFLYSWLAKNPYCQKCFDCGILFKGKEEHVNSFFPDAMPNFMSTVR